MDSDEDILIGTLTGLADREADFLHHSITTLVSTLDIDQVLEKLLVYLKQAVPYQSACVFMQNEDNSFMRSVACNGFANPEAVIGLNYPADDPLIDIIRSIAKPYILKDARDDPRFKGWGDTGDVRGWMGVPLIARGEVFGLLTLDSYAVNAYSSSDANLTQAFANQAAIAIENARLFAIQKQRAEELETLFSTSSAMSAYIELDQVLSEITRQTTATLNGTSCYVSLLEENRLSAKVVAEHYSPEANSAEKKSTMGFSYPINDQYLINLVTNNQVIITHLSDPNGDPTIINQLSTYKGKTALTLPLIARGQIIGELTVWDSRNERIFTETEIRLGQTIANQAAIALEQARLYEVERQRVEQLDALRATAADITAELELPRLLEIILKRAISLISATGGDLGLFDETTSQLMIVTSHNMGKNYSGTRMAMGEGVMGLVAKTLEPRIIQDYRSWNGRSPQYLDGPWCAAMASPLLIHGRLVGTIGIVDANPQRQFTRDDLNLLNLFAQQAAIAIHNAQLHTEVQKLAITDPLTRLYNRRGFFEFGKREIERTRRSKRPLAAIMLDIDHFKKVNDSFSHAVGDEVLIELANRCKARLRKTDLIGRYGGEEFAVLLPDTDEESAIKVAERLRKTVEKKPFETDHGAISITISLGVTTVDENAPELAILLDHADTAMYTAKQAGRNRVSATQINP